MALDLGPRVLTLDDEPLIGMALEANLMSWNFAAVGPATSCPEALSAHLDGFSWFRLP